MLNESRKTGIDVIGNVPWGTHLCQFYQTKDDMTDTLVPYFKAGLENSEYCMWVTSDPLSVEDAANAMRGVMPDFDDYVKKGQIEIIPHTAWYLKDGYFDLQRVMNGWVDKLGHALAKGYHGMRITGNTAWLEKKDWKNFADYEKEINSTIGKYKIIAICTYALDKCDASEIVDVVANHQFALIKREGKWTSIEGAEKRHEKEEKILQKLNRSLRMLSLVNGALVLAEDEKHLFGEVCNIIAKEGGHHLVRIYLKINDNEKTLLLTSQAGDANSSFDLAKLTWADHEVGKGPIGTTARTSESFISQDLKTDPRFIPWREEALKLGIASFISLPLTSKEGVLGVLTIYDTEPDIFNVEEVNLLGELTHDLAYGIIALRTRAERENFIKKLKESEEKFHSIAASAQDAIVMMDYDGNVSFWNTAAEKMFGYTEKEALGKNIHTWITPEQYREASSKGLEIFKRTGTGPVVDTITEVTALKKDGTEFPIELSVVRIEIAGKKNAVGIIRDMTRRKKIENNLLEASLYARSLIEASLDPLVTISPDGVITDVNEATVSATGVLRESLIGSDFSNYFTEPDKARAGYKEVFTKGFVTDYPLSLRHISGKIIDVLYNASVYRDQQGNVAGVFAAARDITKQKKAEQTLKKSEQGLAEAQRMAHLGSWELDLVNNILSWSEENYRIFGFEHKKFDATYEAFLETLHPDDREFVNKAYTDSVKTRTPYNIDHRLLMKDGAVKYVNERCETFYDEHGKPLRSIGTTYDITERKIAETKIKRLANLYSTLSQCNKAIVYSNNKEELFTQICKAAVEESHFKMAWIGLVDTPSKQIVPVASYGDTSGYLENIKITIDENDLHGRGPSGTAIREGEPFWCQDFQNDPRTTPWHDTGARAGWAASAAIPIYQKGSTVGAITLYAGEINAFDEPARNLLTEMASDISYALDVFIDKAEKKEIEANIKESKVQDEAIMDSLGEGMIAVDKFGKIISMNKKAEEITGWEKEEVYRSSITDVIPAIDEHGEKIQPENRPISIVINKGTRVSSNALYFAQKSGQIIPVTVTATPVILNDKIIGGVVIFRDTTQEKELEKTRGDLLTLASHQLRTPLSGTKWLIETLKKGLHGPLTPGQTEYLDEIYKINERMTRLVHDMLGVLRMEGNGNTAKNEDVSVKDILETLFETLRGAAEERRITIHMPGNTDFVINTDPLLFRNILESLISNAINYSKPEAEVQINIEKTPTEIVFAVKDFGIGIPKDEQPRIFERFYRASNAKTFDTRGSGLGLYIAAMLAEKIGAKISLESDEGHGSTFYMHLPLPESEQ